MPVVDNNHRVTRVSCQWMTLVDPLSKAGQRLGNFGDHRPGDIFESTGDMPGDCSRHKTLSARRRVGGGVAAT
jgi:hypothetical protein